MEFVITEVDSWDVLGILAIESRKFYTPAAMPTSVCNVRCVLLAVRRQECNAGDIVWGLQQQRRPSWIKVWAVHL